MDEEEDSLLKKGMKMKWIMLQSRHVQEACSHQASRAEPRSLFAAADQPTRGHKYSLHNLKGDQQSQQLEAEKWKRRKMKRRRRREEWFVTQIIEETQQELKENLKRIEKY